MRSAYSMSMKWSGACSAAELGLGAGTPAVGLGAEVGDLVDGCGRAEESGHVGGQRFGRQAVDHGMAFAAPAEGRGNGEQRQKEQSEMRAERRFHVGPEYKGQREAVDEGIERAKAS